jgi:hypothetical protein
MRIKRTFATGVRPDSSYSLKQQEILALVEDLNRIVKVYKVSVEANEFGLALCWYNPFLVCEMQEASSGRVGAGLQGGEGAVEMEMRLMRNRLHD